MPALNAKLCVASAMLLAGAFLAGILAPVPLAAEGKTADARLHDFTAQKKSKKQPAKKPKPGEFPAREPFTPEEQNLAGIPNMPDARFWSDSVADFKKALPAGPGPWLVLSSGGGDGAFGAGLLNGWSESGARPEF